MSEQVTLVQHINAGAKCHEIVVSCEWLCTGIVQYRVATLCMVEGAKYAACSHGQTSLLQGHCFIWPMSSLPVGLLSV